MVMNSAPPVIRAPAFYNNGSRYLPTVDQGLNLIDNQSLELGTGQDVVLFLRSASLSADEEITGAMAGTSDHQGVAANSFILSNITTDGDIMFLVSDGGNSKEFLLADADTAILYLGHGMASVTVKTASGDLNLNPGGDIDASSNAINNIGTSGFNLTSAGLVDVAGVSGNFWSSSRIVHKGSGRTQTETTSADTNSIRNVFKIMHTTSEDMEDGFGTLILFAIEDAGAADQEVGSLGFRRAGADNTGDFILRTRVTGSSNEAFKITALGIGSFDLAGAGDGVPSLHDDKDDAMVLYQGLSGGDLDMLESIGIVERKDTGSGWMINLQPMLMLTAGGVYQNRARMDAQYAEIDKRLQAIGA